MTLGPDPLPERPPRQTSLAGGCTAALVVFVVGYLLIMALAVLTVLIVRAVQ